MTGLLVILQASLLLVLRSQDYFGDIGELAAFFAVAYWVGGCLMLWGFLAPNVVKFRPHIDVMIFGSGAALTYPKPFTGGYMSDYSLPMVVLAVSLTAVGVTLLITHFTGHRNERGLPTASPKH